MNREIKFRAWDDGAMIYSHTNTINDSNFQLKFFFERVREDAVIMQFTGLHDKNGKEIYEGDIYQTQYGKNYKIMFINGCFVGGKTDGFCSPMGWEADYDGNDLIESNYCSRVEIIGNIYEHKHLLDGQ